MSALAEMIDRLEAAPPAVRKEMLDLAASVGKTWIPNEGPQSDAYFSKADCLLYGGEPGGGKTQLLLGLAFNEHQRTMVFRRQYTDLDRIIEDALSIHGSRQGFNGSPPPKLRINDNQVISFRAAQRIGDEQSTMGQGRDLLAIDEATHFAESQIRFLMGWVRSEDPTQRCRTVLATNPPLSAEGLWVINMFAPWLDPRYANPAKPGELRWVVTDEDGNDLWVNGPDDAREVNGKTIHPTSRTYIPSSVKDNPYYAGSDYERQLDNLSEPFRSLLLGGFRAEFKDDPSQVIPTAWVIAAQARWSNAPPVGVPMCAMGVDCTGGGDDPLIIAPRYDGWFQHPIAVPGKDIPMDSIGRTTAGHVIKHRRDGAAIVLDMGGGYGGPAYEHLKDNFAAGTSENPGEHAVIKAHKGSEGSSARTADRQYGFTNKRSEVIWRFREALDPDQEGGSPIMLPDDPELVADLTAPTFQVVSGKIKVEEKTKVCERLGRSTDKGDAVVMCWSYGDTFRNVKGGDWSGHRRRKVTPKVKVSHPSRRKR